MNAVLLTGGNGKWIDRDIELVRSYVNLFIGRILTQSAVYESAPWGFEADTNFLNQALLVDTSLSADDLLDRIWQIEAVFGRNRGSADEELAKWQSRKNSGVPGYHSRNMDIDILLYGDTPIETERLSIPHPKIPERSFVLTPLIDLLGDHFILQGKTLSEHLSTL